jgi:hypothetical protein
MDRRDALKLSAGTLLAGLNPAALTAAPALRTGAIDEVEQWGIFELALNAKAGGNPFLDVTLTAEFVQNHRTVRVTGFYDGGEIFRLRFMPDATGFWTFTTQSSLAALHGRSGSFTCSAAKPGNHGPVTTARSFTLSMPMARPTSPSARRPMRFSLPPKKMRPIPWQE